MLTSTASRTAVKTANAGTEQVCGKTRNILRPFDAVMRAAQTLWPSKTALELAAATGTSQRACEYWLARRSQLSFDAVVELLRSDDGLIFLEAIMGPARPVWWKRMKRSAQRSALRSAQRELQRQIDQMELELDQ
jgi:hypothetical protein